MKLSSMFSASTLTTICVPLAAFSLWQGNQAVGFSALSIGFVSLLSGWLNSEPTRIKNNDQLPKEATKKLANSLHHSQIPLLEQIIQPIMAKEFPTLHAQKVGETLAGHSISLFDEKIKKLSEAFSTLKASRDFYQKRTLDDRDRAITLLTFFAILFEEQASEENLGLIYQKIPPQAFKMLRKQAYRLFDLSYLLLEKRLVINSELVKTFADLSLFNRYDLNSAGKAYPMLFESKPTLQTSLPTSECESPPAASIKTQEPQPQSISENELSLSEKVLPVTKPLAPKITKEGEGNEENQTALKETKPTNNSEQQDLISAFISWLEKRIVSGNRQFSIESQNLVITNPEKYGNTQVFVLPDVLGKYQSRSGIEACVMKQALWDKSGLTTPVFVEKEGNPIEITPCVLSNPFESQVSSQINEGEPTCVQP